MDVRKFIDKKFVPWIY